MFMYFCVKDKGYKSWTVRKYEKLQMFEAKKHVNKKYQYTNIVGSGFKKPLNEIRVKQTSLFKTKSVKSVIIRGK